MNQKSFTEYGVELYKLTKAINLNFTKNVVTMLAKRRISDAQFSSETCTEMSVSQRANSTSFVCKRPVR